MALAIILGPRLGKYGPGGRIRVVPGAQHRLRRDWHVHPALWLDGLQSRINPGCDRPPHLSDRREYESRGALPDRPPPWCSGILPFGKPDITMACNGMLAGLVAITAPCAFVSPTSAAIIGALAGLLVCGGVLFNDRVLKDRRSLRRDLGARLLRMAGRSLRRHLRRRHLRCGMERSRRRELSRTRWTGSHWPAPRRHEAVLVPAHGSDHLCRVGLRCDLRCLHAGEQSEKHARRPRGRRRRSRRTRIWYAGLSRGCSRTGLVLNTRWNHCSIDSLSH